MQYSTMALNQNTIMAIAGTLVFCSTGFGGEIIPSNQSLKDGRQAINIDVPSEYGTALCGSETLTQSTNNSVINPNSVWCGTDTSNDESSLARAFVAPFDMTLKCVDFAIAENTGGDATVHVRVLVGSVSSAYSELTLVSETDVLIADGTALTHYSVDIADAQIPAGMEFIIELHTDSRLAQAGGDGGLISFGTNTFGQSEVTYLRGPLCGVEDFVDTASFGFGDRNLVMSLGIEGSITPTVQGGFSMSAIGNAVMSQLGDELIVAGDPNGGEFGIGVGFGSYTGGVGGSFRVLGDGEVIGAEVSMAFLGETQSDILRFSDYLGDPSQAVLDLEFDNLGFDLFDMYVYNDGQLVGIIENQSSGTVLLSESPTGARTIGSWLLGLFGIGVEGHCNTAYTYFENGNLQSCTTSYGVSIGTSTIAPIDGGESFVGNEIQLIPLADSTGSQTPIFVEFTTSGAQAIALDVGSDSPSVAIGNALSQPQFYSGGGWVSAQVGVSFSLAQGDSGSTLVGEDVDGDGLADLTVSSFSGPVSVDMFLGGVDSATIEIDMHSSIIPCLSICPWWDIGGPSPVPGCKLDFDPWPNPFGDDLLGVLPDFEGIGDGSFTVQYWNNGQLVGESFTSGTVGGTAQLPVMFGVINDDQQLGFSASYPSETEFTTADGQSIIMDEIIVVVDNQGTGASLAIMNIRSEGLDKVAFSNPTTVVASFFGCPADITGDGTLNFFDVSAFLSAFGSQQAEADFNNDGQWNFFDVSAFLTAFSQGCP